MAEHAQRYARVADAFTAQGWLVVAHDHRGHGESVPPGETPGHMGNDDAWNTVVGDLLGITRTVAGEHGKLPLVLLAHSMGSFMAQQLLFTQPDEYAAVALSGSNGKPPPIAQLGRVITRLERLRLGRHRNSNLLQKLSFGDFNKGFPGRTEFDWLSRDDDEVDKYVADPLCGFPVSVQSWLDFIDAVVGLTDPAKLARIPKDKPVYLFAGANDPVGDRGAGVERLAQSYRDAGLTNLLIRLYPDARHETLNETNRDEVIADLFAWASQWV